MKKETKELIKWAMSLIADYRVQNMVEHSNFRKNTPAAQNSEIEIKNCKDFAEFLNSLPEIESHLCNGGYIQDRNGTPCCHGDNLKCVLVDTPEDDWFYGKLTWRGEAGTFLVLTQTKTLYLAEIKWFEKVEK